MSSVDELLTKLSDIDKSLDFANSLNAIDQRSSVEGLMRAACIQSFSVFEQFLKDRAVEWATYLSSKRIAPSSLPAETNLYQKRVVNTLPKRFDATPESDRARLVNDLASSLGSFSTNSLIAHDSFFSWKGSNVQEVDIEQIVQLAGVKDAWSELTSFWSKFDKRKPSNVNAKNLLKEISEMRHLSAHDSTKIPARLNALAATKQVRQLSIMIDGVVSTGLWRAATSKPKISSAGSKIAIRRIERDGKIWREFGPNNPTRAAKRHSSLQDAMQDSPARARADGEFILALDGYEVVNWKSAI